MAQPLQVVAQPMVSAGQQRVPPGRLVQQCRQREQPDRTVVRELGDLAGFPRRRGRQAVVQGEPGGEAAEQGGGALEPRQVPDRVGDGADVLQPHREPPVAGVVHPVQPRQPQARGQQVVHADQYTSTS